MANWSSTAAALKYYRAEGFIYVESVCSSCGYTQRTVVYPDSRIVQCLNCSKMTSTIVRDIDA